MMPIHIVWGFEFKPQLSKEEEVIVFIFCVNNWMEGGGGGGGGTQHQSDKVIWTQ